MLDSVSTISDMMEDAPNGVMVPAKELAEWLRGEGFDPLTVRIQGAVAGIGGDEIIVRPGTVVRAENGRTVRPFRALAAKHTAFTIISA